MPSFRVPCHCARCSIHRAAFTLVELLVVIGIIAVLISILLPALSTARRQAAQAKCAAQLREIGNAFSMYALDSKGWYPPAQLVPIGGRTYNVDGTNYPTAGVGAYWSNFLARYVTKTKFGVTSTTVDDAATARRSIFWGCPSFDGYYTGAIGGYNRVQTGLGMNTWPTFTSRHPAPPANFPPNSETTFIRSWGDPAAQVGNFQKQVVYGRQGAQRGLVADSRFWAIESNPCPPLASDPSKGDFPPQSDFNVSITYTPGVAGQTMIDVYRHGKYPGRGPVANTFAKTGGKVAYNVLYCDGHVGSDTTQRSAYESLRQRFPN